MKILGVFRFSLATLLCLFGYGLAMGACLGEVRSDTHHHHEASAADQHSSEKASDPCAASDCCACACHAPTILPEHQITESFFSTSVRQPKYSDSPIYRPATPRLRPPVTA